MLTADEFSALKRSLLKSDDDDEAVARAVATVPGCFADNSTQRQLTHEVCGFGKGAWASLSRTYCGQQCQLANYTLAGVEAGHSCWCGDAVRSPAAALPLSACNESCTGAPHETCGARFRIWVFASASVGPPPAPARPIPSVGSFVEVQEFGIPRAGGYGLDAFTIGADHYVATAYFFGSKIVILSRFVRCHLANPGKYHYFRPEHDPPLGRREARALADRPLARRARLASL